MIQIKNIVKNYTAGDTVVNALKSVSINFRENEFVSILGPSGCGKTTLLNVLGGLDRYDSGEISINGKSTKEFNDKDWDAYRNHYIGFIFQSYNLIPHLNVLENVEIALTIAGLNKKEKKQLATKALVRVGLGEQINKKPNQLSGGQMQRVAIARAIVNNPKIILADEPTGALDSETSVQIMDLLKEIAGDHLIIMVTHNKDLADKYSSRIISLLDGSVTADTNPFEPKNEQPSIGENKTQEDSKNIEENNITEDNKDKDSKKPKKTKSAMGFFTAFMLSLKNLLSKKGRTFMTSFAGSIGIIGIALVLAVSNGFTGYINKIQSDTLSGYPIAISTVTVNMSAIEQRLGSGQQEDEQVEFPSDKKVYSYNMVNDLAKFSQYNFLSPDFIEYMKAYESEDAKKSDGKKTLSDIEYSYASSLPVFTTNSKDEIIKIDTSLSTSVLGGDQSGAFSEGLSNDEFIKDKYDILEGTYPQDKTDLALVVDSYNRVSMSTLTALGIDDNSKTDFAFSEIIGKEYKVFLNDAYYDNAFKPIEDKAVIESTFNSTSENVITCKISCILRIKQDNPTSIYSSGIKYSNKLTSYTNQKNRESKIVKAQLENTSTFFVPFEFGVKELGTTFKFYFIDHENENLSLKKFVKNNYNVDLTTQQLQEYGLQMLGASTIPVSIKLYPVNFDAKDQITSYISDWNKTEKGKTNQIIYSDQTAFLTSTMGQMVDIISYVLIAFAAISLIVSSIMISIITYVSVIERTKEIGVLRSIGARKKDISRVFNAETLIIGLCSGVLGVLVSFILTFPISAIIKSVAGGTITTNMAVLAPTSALILVVISVVLTMLAGFIPAKMAAKKDPVKALRSE